MNEFAKSVLAGWLASRRMFGCTFTVAGVTGEFKGILNQGDDAMRMATGGFFATFAGSLEYLPSEVTIAKGGKVTMGGVAYRVEAFNGSPDDPVRVALLVGVNK